MRTRGDPDVFPIAPLTTTQVKGQYDDDEMAIWVHQDAAKCGCDYLDSVKRTWIHLEKNDITPFVCHDSSLITLLKRLLSDAASRVAAAMVY
ncbi:hypothetical protein TNCV_3528551 [Trichonephila clavipes]|nr:hypothetical protein TNCV_3528551 [Trichonephila clavipes]